MRALITGITGQDGSYLAELLLRKSYEVWGITRQAPSTCFSDMIKIMVATDMQRLKGDEHGK